MPRLIAAPTIVAAAGTKPKTIEEYAGRVNSGHASVSVARMTSPSGWEEPGQRPEFEEITVVLRGMVRVEHDGGVLDVRAVQAIVTAPGEWVRYSSPEPDGAEYVAVCIPAFSPSGVYRDPSKNAGRIKTQGAGLTGLQKPGDHIQEITNIAGGDGSPPSDQSTEQGSL